MDVDEEREGQATRREGKESKDERQMGSERQWEAGNGKKKTDCVMKDMEGRNVGRTELT